MSTIKELIKQQEEHEYTCAHCKNVYKKGWSDEEAIEEQESIFGKVSKEDLAIVCDDCFNTIKHLFPIT